MSFKKSCDFTLWDGVFLPFTVLLLPRPPHPAPTNCWRSCVVVFCLELEFGNGHKRVELGDQVTYFRGVPCMKLTCNSRSALPWTSVWMMMFAGCVNFCVF